jgi:hypothetical protein
MFQPASLDIGICRGLHISGERRPTSDFDWLDYLLQLEKNQMARVLGVYPDTCFMSLKLNSGVAWVQKDPAKVTTSAPVRV